MKYIRTCNQCRQSFVTFNRNRTICSKHCQSRIASKLGFPGVSKEDTRRILISCPFVIAFFILMYWLIVIAAG